MDAELETLLDRIPVLQGLQRTVEDLPGGLTNHNLRVRTQAGDHVVRRFEGDADLLGIDRDAEARNTRAAAEAGVGVPVVDYLPELGVLVIGYLPGRTLDNDSFTDAGALARAGRAIRRLHDGPSFAGGFDMFARQASYLQTVERQGFPLVAGYATHDEAFHRVERALAVHPEPAVPCNNDLLAGNFIDDGQQVWLIDYEYSGANAASFELGNTATECDLDEAQVEALVAAYDGSVTAQRLARVRLQMLVSAYGWALWGAIQSAASSIDHDFDGWSRERSEKAARGFTATGFDALLQTAAHG